MVLQDLVDINKAEKEAEEILYNAKIKSDFGIKAAKDTATKKYNEATVGAKLDYESMVEGIVNMKSESIDNILKIGLIETENIYNTPRKKIDEAVDMVFKKVVNLYGNS